VQTQPQTTSLIPNPANGNIGMTAANRKMHKQISIMQIHAQNMQKFVLEKNRYADLSTEVQPRSGLEQPRPCKMHPAAIKDDRNNFLRGIFLTVLKLFVSWNNIPATVYYAASASYCMQPSDIDILPPEKIAFIAYNVGVFESVQKFGNLITSGKIASGMDPEKVAELLAESRAFYDSEMIAQLVNGMLAQQASANLPMTVDRVTASQVDYVLSQLKAAGVQL
jgi:hypothetical protein